MLTTVLGILALIALALTIWSAVEPPRVPLWIAVLILSICELLRDFPLGR